MWRDWHHIRATSVQGIGNYTKAEPLAVKKSVGTHGGALGLAILVSANYLLPATAQTGRVGWL